MKLLIKFHKYKWNSEVRLPQRAILTLTRSTIGAMTGSFRRAHFP